MKGLKLGITTLSDLESYLEGAPTDGGGVTVNRGLLRVMLKAVKQNQTLVACVQRGEGWLFIGEMIALQTQLEELK